MGLISRVSSRTYRQPCEKSTMSFVNPEDFQHILRVQNTNIDGNIKVTHALTAIRGMGRRFTDVVLKKAEIDRSKRAGQLSEAKWNRSKPSWLTQRTSRSHFGFEQTTRLERRKGRSNDLQQLG